MIMSVKYNMVLEERGRSRYSRTVGDSVKLLNATAETLVS